MVFAERRLMRPAIEHAKLREEIEITPEMIEAGADVILGCDLEFYRPTEVAEMVFKTMASLRSRDLSGTSSVPHTHRK